MILGLGTDVVDVARFGETLLRRGERFIERVFTEAERDHCAGRVERLAARFAAKEAVLKALGTGLSGCRWVHIDIVPNASGAPQVRLSGGAFDIAERMGVTDIHLSISHTRTTAMAVAVLESRSR